jgi:hypothetical protein
MARSILSLKGFSIEQFDFKIYRFLNAFNRFSSNILSLQRKNNYPKSHIVFLSFIFTLRFINRKSYWQNRQFVMNSFLKKNQKILQYNEIFISQESDSNNLHALNFIFTDFKE